MGKNTLWKEIESASSWSKRIEILCKRLNIPDLTKRGGLRVVHRTFPDLFKRLSTCYNENFKHCVVQGAVVVIYARMCVDSLLRNKLVSEKSFFSQVVPLLHVPECHTPALQCFAILTRHGGMDIRYRIAGYTADLVKLGQSNIDDPFVTAPCSVIISHCITAVLCPGEGVPVDQKALKSIGSLVSVFGFMEALLRNPHTTYESYNHTIHFIMDASQNARGALFAVPSCIAIMVAALRSSDLALRISALGSLMRLHYNVAFKGKAQWDPQVVVRNYMKRGQNSPDGVVDAMVNYGMFRTETVSIMTCTRAYQDAMLKFAQNTDYYALGMKLFELIGKTEFSLGEGYYADANGKPIPMGLPFVNWMDAIPYCAKAIREKGDPAKYDIANIIELKFFIARCKYKETKELAEEGLKINPIVAFYYYALSLATTVKEDALRWAKKGLKCEGPTMTQYVRLGLLFQAITNAGLLGIEYLTTAEQGQNPFEEAYTFLRVALDDAKHFVEEAPPDNRHVPSAISWCILLSLTLRGPEINLDLREIQGFLRTYKTSEDIQKWIMGQPLQNTQLRLAQQDVMKHYKSATEEWGPLISHFDIKPEGHEEGCRELVPGRSAHDELADWLDETKLDGEEGHEHEHEHGLCHNHDHEHSRNLARTAFGSEIIELYTCSHCRNPSVKLKKCTRCLKAKYCDASCQKLHWPDHKKMCKPPTTA